MKTPCKKQITFETLQYLFILYLFNEALGSSDNTTPKDIKNNKN
jgi:hypothetical protein